MLNEDSTIRISVIVSIVGLLASCMQSGAETTGIILCHNIFAECRPLLTATFSCGAGVTI